VVEIDRYKRTGRVDKFLLPRAKLVFGSRSAQSMLSVAETATAMLQGKGSGSGWDIFGEVTAAMKFIRANSTVFDIGANHGDWSRYVYKQLSGNIDLYLFEPQDECCNTLRALFESGAHLIKAAVGDADSKSVLYSPGNGGGNASLHMRKDTYFSDQVFYPIAVDTISIDSFIALHQIASVDFMKMDIEGHELYALQGARTSLASGTIRALSFEVGSGNINSRTFFRDYWDLLTEYHYHIFRVLPGGDIVPVAAYYEDFEYFRGVSNYIAVSPNYAKL
jgi:FkbM family methyltransferase